MFTAQSCWEQIPNKTELDELVGVVDVLLVLLERVLVRF